MHRTGEPLIKRHNRLINFFYWTISRAYSNISNLNFLLTKKHSLTQLTRQATFPNRNYYK